jgi:hypothetical protein
MWALLTASETACELGVVLEDGKDALWIGVILERVIVGRNRLWEVLKQKRREVFRLLLAPGAGRNKATIA